MQDRNATRLRKIIRLADGKPPRVMDLFSGCGGISLGFHRAGYKIVANVEIDRHAAETHATNFHTNLERFRRHRDITVEEPEDLVREQCQTDVPDQSIDVIVGGPPCQAYTRVGRAKLRDVAQHPEAFLQDPRGNLYLRYLHYVERLQPLALVMENVPDSLNYGGVNIPQEVADSLTAMGYECQYTLLNAVHYGVPQLRERMILIAIAKELHLVPKFPRPTNNMVLPDGYRHMRQALLPNDRGMANQSEQNYYVPSPTPSSGRPAHRTAQDALSDLPPMVGRQEKSNNPYGADVPYPEVQNISDYAKDMRTWPGFQRGDLVRDHVTRALLRDYPIFRRMAWGDQYPAAYRIAEGILEGRLHALGFQASPGDAWYENLRAKIVPPYDPGKFPNKWRKMEPDQPARTLLAHLGKDCYTHIHYHDEQARTISVREAARLQSFPDGFRFPRTLNAAFRMIGNAVPPLLAFCIARQLKRNLREGATHFIRASLERSPCLETPSEPAGV